MDVKAISSKLKSCGAIINTKTGSVKKMQFQKSKLGALTVIIVLLTTFIVQCSVKALMDLPSQRFIIHSSGSISHSLLHLPGVYRSEIREIAVTRTSMGGCDWDLIAQTVKQSNFTCLAAPMLFNYIAYYPSNYVPHSGRNELALAIQAAHSYDLDFRVSMGVPI